MRKNINNEYNSTSHLSPFSPIKSPVKTNVNNGLNSDYIYDIDIEFMKHFFKKKEDPTIRNLRVYDDPINNVDDLTKNIIKSKVKEKDNFNIFKNKEHGDDDKRDIKLYPNIINKNNIRKPKLIITESFKCKLCKTNSHWTDGCYFKCIQPTCINILHKKKECPFKNKITSNNKF